MTFLAVKIDIAVHQFQIFLYQIQTESCPLAKSGGRLGTEHPLEYERLVDVGNAHAVVRNDDFDLFSLFADSAGYCRSFIGVFAGIGKQIGNYRFEFNGIGFDKNLRAGGMEDKFLLRVVLLEHFKHAFTKIHHIEYGDNQEILVRIFQMLKFQCAVNHIVQPHGIVVYGFECLFAFGVFCLFFHQTYRAEDHRKGRFEIV